MNLNKKKTILNSILRTRNCFQSRSIHRSIAIERLTTNASSVLISSLLTRRMNQNRKTTTTKNLRLANARLSMMTMMRQITSRRKKNNNDFDKNVSRDNVDENSSRSRQRSSAKTFEKRKRV